MDPLHWGNVGHWPVSLRLELCDHGAKRVGLWGWYSRDGMSTLQSSVVGAGVWRMLMLQSDAEQTGTRRTLALHSDAELTKERRMLALQSGTEWTKFQHSNQMGS